MKRRTVLVLAMLVLAALVVPFFALQVQGDTDAGPDQTVYVDDAVSFNATTSEDINAVANVTWDFGDGTLPLNGTDSGLLNAIHTYNATGEYNVTLSVGYNSQLNKTETDTLKVTVVENVAPVADAGPDQTVEQTSSAGAEVTLNGSASSDQYGDVLTYNWSWIGGSASGVNPTVAFPQGTTEVTLTVDDGVFNATDALNITVVDTTAPDVDAGDDVTVEATSPTGAEVTLTGEATDAVDANLDFVWSEGGTVLGTDANLTVTLTLGTHTLTLNATDDSANTGTDSVTVEVVDTTAPAVDAGDDVTVEATSPAGAEVTLVGNAVDVVDPDLDFVWSEANVVLGTEANLTYTFSLGTHELTLNATDDSGNTGTDTVIVEVVDTTPPVVDAGEDVTVEATSYAGAEVTLVGTASDIADPDLDYEWKEGTTVLGTEANLTYTFSLGTHVLTLSATDDSGNTASDTVTVEVVDTTAPELTVAVDPDLLWPPNHKYVDVETTVTVHDLADPNPTVTLVSVTSNEPENGKGDGNTTDDIQILSDTTFKLRAERSGPGEGRIYTITYRATDASGNSVEVSVTITVPHNQ